VRGLAWGGGKGESIDRGVGKAGSPREVTSKSVTGWRGIGGDD